MKHLILIFPLFLTSCAMFQHEKIKDMELCIGRMVEKEIPADVAGELCEKIYKNIHTEHRRAMTEAQNATNEPQTQDKDEDSP